MCRMLFDMYLILEIRGPKLNRARFMMYTHYMAQRHVLLKIKIFVLGYCNTSRGKNLGQMKILIQKISSLH